MYNLFGLLILASLVCVLVSLIKPSLFRFLPWKASRIKTVMTFVGCALLFFVLFGATYPSEPNTTPKAPVSPSLQNPSPTITSTVTSAPTAPTPTPEPCADQIGTKNYAPCEVTLQTQDELSRPLNVTVRADNRAVYVTNPSSTELAQCTVVVGTDPTADNYVSDGFVVKAGQTVDVGWGNMANEENERFNYYTTKPDSVSIACTVGGTTNKDGSYTGGGTHRSNFNF